MLHIRDEDIKKALKDGTNKIMEIHIRLINLREELLNVDSLIRSISIQTCQYKEIVTTSSGTNKDLNDLMELHEILTKQRKKEILQEMRQLIREEETINRIRTCFQALRGREYTYLNELYVKNRPYKFVEKNSGVSHRTFESVRKRGINKIIEMYESNKSNQQIICHYKQTKEEDD